MKLRKHLGRRVFALFLALLLSFNSLTVLAEDNPVNPETPAAESVEVTEPADDTEVPTGSEAVDAESVEATEAEDTAESTEAKAEVKDGGVDESLNSEAAVNAEQPETEQPETEPAEEELPETKTETTDGETDSSETDVTPSEAEVQDREPAVNAQEDAPAVEEQKTADIADTDANVQKEADLPAEPVQDEISAGDGEVEAAPTEYATVDEFNAAVESMGDAEDEEAVYAVIARCQSIYERLSDADKDAMAEAYAAILSYAEDLGQSEIEALGLGTGHYLQVNVQKVYKTSSGTYKQYQGSATAYIYCTDGTGHSGYNHGINVSDFWPANFGWSTGDDWLGWAKGNYWPGSYTDKWYNWQKPTTTINASVTGKEPYEASQYIYLVYKEPVPTYTITYLDGYGGTVQVYKNVSAGEKTPRPANPSRTGYTFDGWTPSVAATVTGDATYTAKWKLDQTYYAQIIYNSNANGETVNGMPGQEVYSGENPSPVHLLSRNTPTRAGYTFKGWASSRTSKTTVSSITLSTSMTSPGPVNRVYAIWEKNDDQGGITLTKTRTTTLGESRFPAQVGDTITWDIKVTNTSKTSVRHVKLTDNVMEDVILEYNGQKGNGTLKVEVPADTTITVKATHVLTEADYEKAQQNALNRVYNSVSGVCDEIVNGNPIKGSATDGGTKMGVPELTVSKEVRPETAKPGEEIVYTITVTNASKLDAKNVTVTDILPAGLTLVSATLNGGKVTPANGVYQIDRIAANNGKAVLKITAKVEESAAGSAIVNTATADFENREGELPSSSATVTITEPDTPKDETTTLSVTKSADKTELKPGDEVEYTITVRNTGVNAAKNVTVTDKLDSSLTFVSAKLTVNGSETNVTPDAEGRYTIGEIAQGGEAVLKITAKVSEDLDTEAVTSIRNVATAGYENKPSEPTDPEDPDSPKEPIEDPKGEVETPVSPEEPENPDNPETPKDETTTLSVTKSADKTELKPGDEVEYTITVRNTGANAAKNVTVTDKLDSSLTFVSAKLTVNGSETNITPDAEGRYTIGEIAQGGEAVLKITAKVSEDLDTEAVTSIRNVATAGYENKPGEPIDPEDPDSPKEPIEDPKGEVETPVSPEDPENPDNPDNPEKPDATYTVTWVSGYDDTVYQTENNLKREDIADNHPTTEPTREGYTFTGWNIGEPDADGNIVVTAQWTPTEPTDPEGPTDPETPTEPTDPEGPTDPETPTEPTDPEGPTDPETPTEPTDPEGPTDPETPTEPTDPEGPTDSETPGEPTDPEGPADPETPVEPENSTPGTPADPTPGTPDEPETEVPDEPADAEQPVTPPAPVPVPVTVTPAAATPVAAQIVPVNPTPVTPAAENEPAAPEEEVTLPEETVPAAAPEEETETVDIGDEEVPMAEFGGKGSPAWALLNLILTILTALISLLLLTFYFTGKRKEENEERAGRNTEDEDEDELKRKGLIRLLSILPAVFAMITFILTEDMRNPMIIVDRWTILMLLYAVVNVVLAVFAIKKREEKEEEKAVK